MKRESAISLTVILLKEKWLEWGEFTISEKIEVDLESIMRLNPSLM